MSDTTTPTTPIAANDHAADPSNSDSGYAPTACILCECNCGIEVRLGGESQHGPGRRFERIRGDKNHPASKGYTCEKALRLDHYQNGTHRITSPLRRRADGTYEEIDWDTAIREVAAGFKRVRDTHGGESIFYFGGGGQGNHLGGSYSGATMRALGSRYKANALSQEKTGEFWVNAKMIGTMVRADFEHCEVALFVGKNPWQSHGFPRARTTLKEIARDAGRHMIVIDPRRTETAELADIHLAVNPGTDAWCVSAMAAVLVQEDLIAHTWLRDHANGVDEVIGVLRGIDIAGYCRMSGVAESDVRSAARLIAKASSVAVFEDLGVQMNLHSTLVSYLEKLLWTLTGNFGKPGAQYAFTSLVALARGGGDAKRDGKDRRSPVAGARIISGLIPCNVIPEEILTDHPDRYRAMLVESANPAHSLADSKRMREALASLDHLVVIDVAMSETARLAHYVLPASSQFEKHEATFFNFDWPRNVFHLRRPLLDPLPGTLPEPEIHARLVEALGVLPEELLVPLKAAAQRSRAEFATAFFEATTHHPILGELAPIVLYRTLGPTLPHGAASAAILWGAAQRCALGYPDSVARAGFTGEGLEPGEKLFEAILASPSGVVFSYDEPDDSWRRVRTDSGKFNLAVPEMLAALTELGDVPQHDPDYPFVLSAGERRSFSANTIIRDPKWRKKDAAGALRVSPADAQRIGLVEGGRARLTTHRGSAEVDVEITDMMRDGHVSLPNGLGIDYRTDEGALVMAGVAPNELTDSMHRDPIAGTPFHKHVRSRVEAL